MIVASWNIRGFNLPLKHREMQSFLRKKNINVMAILETKLDFNSVAPVMQKKFSGWLFSHNFQQHQGGRILIMWRPDQVNLSILDSQPQFIHCLIGCKTSHIEFEATFVYGLHSITSRRSLWDQLLLLGESMVRPWLVLGDFNSILSPLDRINGNAVSDYETSDFAHCCNSTGLGNMTTIGPFHTWTNGRVWSKLDRALCSVQFPDFSHAEASAIGSISDHASIIVNVGAKLQRGNTPFKFINAIAEHASYFSLVEEYFRTVFSGTKQFCLCKKLKLLKGPLKRLSKDAFTNLSSKIDTTEQQYDSTLSALQLNPTDRDLGLLAKKLRAECLSLRRTEYLILSQQVKNNFLVQADRGSKFFHDLIKATRKRRFIASIKGPDGQFTKSQHDMGSQFENYFVKLMGSRIDTTAPSQSICDRGPKLDPSCFEGLLAPVTKQDVWEVINAMDNNKSPGPDGFNAKFFKSAWYIIGDDVFEAISEFFASGKLLKQINHSLIALIPKCEGADDVSQFRPIACCNTLYKIISKILANRIAHVIDSLIDSSQAAFVKNRSMIENIFLVQELVRKYARKRSSPRCMLKIDLHKAYDSISWDFLEWMIQSLGFPQQFCNWIMECVSTASFSIVLNGSIYGHFNGQRGIRQGDPLSPYLFVLCMEYLSRDLKGLTNDASFHMHPACTHDHITHLAFADDILLFCRGDMSSIRGLMKCLDHFHSVSGLLINKDKSALFSAGMSPHAVQEAVTLSGFGLGELPFRYLGVPLLASRLNVCHYAPLINQITNLTQGWKNRNLSYAGRVELIRAVVQGIINFWMGIFPIPCSVIKKISSLCRNFLWGHNNSGNVKPLISWKNICLPKSEGGVGLLCLKTWNNALLSRILWDCHSKKDSLWVRWVHHYYFKGHSIWDYRGNKYDSVFIKRLVQLRNQVISREGSTQAAILRLASWAIDDGISVRKVYDFLRIPGPKVDWERVIWNKGIPPRYAFHLWLAAKKRLLTLDKAQFMNKGIGCLLCNSDIESNEHILFACRTTKPVWNIIRDWIAFGRNTTSLYTSIRFLARHRLSSGRMGQIRCLALAFTSYCVWSARNSFVYDQIPFNVSAVIEKIKFLIYRYNHLLRLYS